MFHMQDFWGRPQNHCQEKVRMTPNLMNKDGYQGNDDEPDDRAELSMSQPPQSPCLAAQLLMVVLFLLVVSEVICQKAMPLLKCELGRRALGDVFCFQQTCRSSL